MNLETADWVVIAIYLAIAFVIGLWASKKKTDDITDFFIAGRSLPWWLLGTSIAATWFATDAPLAITALVRSKGIYGNWLWWYLGMGIMMMVFFYAKQWRRAEIVTDAEYIELRYSGQSAAILRGFSAAFYGVFKNCFMLGWVMLAMLKFSQVMLGWSAEFALLVTTVFALIHTISSGMWGVVVLDMLHFTAGIVSTIILAIMILFRVGGPTGLSEKIMARTDAPEGVLDMLPNMAHISPIEFAGFLCLIGVLWLGQAQGDGYITQRLFSAKNEKHAVKASLWFAIAGIVILTWPWIIVGLGSIVILPISEATPELIADPELAYPMMIVEVLPAGLKGLLVAAFMAAFMSTVDTHLCWGGSYVVNDIYKRFIKSDADPQHYVLVSRISIIVLLLLSALTAWQMESIAGAWVYLIEIMSGIAIIGMLRWYWWRINAWSEIATMVTALIVVNGHVFLKLFHNIGFVSEASFTQYTAFYQEEYALIRATLVLIICTIVSLIVTLLTKPVEQEKLVQYYKKLKPNGWWKPIAIHAPEVIPDSTTRKSWIGFLSGVLFLNSILFAVGHLVLGHFIWAVGLFVVGAFCAWMTLRYVDAVSNTTL